METVLFVIHIMVVLALIIMVLLQRSEGGALGIGGGGGGGMMSSRSAGDIMTKITTGLAFCFFLTSIGIAILAQTADNPADILNQLENSTSTDSTGVLDSLGGEIQSPAETEEAPSEPQVPTGN